VASSKWKTDGNITQSGFSKRVSILTKGFLNDTGALAVKNMREITTKHDATGELTDSIMWTTSDTSSNMGSRAKESKALSSPVDQYLVKVGSAAEHAWYRETTSGIHKTSENAELFVKRMKEWYQATFNEDPDLPENKYSFWKLVGFVASTVTDGVPFVAPTKAMIDSTLSERYSKVILRALRAKKE
jgi:Ni,Fe-hydrogenase I large subunit